MFCLYGVSGNVNFCLRVNFLKQYKYTNTHEYHLLKWSLMLVRNEVY